jgi:hypothetical protein
LQSRSYEKAILKMEDRLRNSGLAKPALRALIDHDITTIKALKIFDRNTLHSMHGIGPKAVAIIKVLIKQHS